MKTVEANIIREKDGGPVINWIALKLCIWAYKIVAATEPYTLTVVFSPSKKDKKAS